MLKIIKEEHLYLSASYLMQHGNHQVDVGIYQSRPCATPKILFYGPHNLSDEGLREVGSRVLAEYCGVADGEGDGTEQENPIAPGDA